MFIYWMRIVRVYCFRFFLLEFFIDSFNMFSGCEDWMMLFMFLLFFVFKSFIRGMFILFGYFLGIS